MQNWNLILGISLIASPILFAMIAFPDSIAWSWNEGRGGYLFALVFVVAELIGLKIIISKKRLLAVVPLVLLTISYLVSLEYGLREYIIESAEVFDVQLIYSWTWMWDFIVMGIFIIVTLTIFFGRRWIRIAPAGPIFLTGTAIILSLDAFFPYDTLGPLQYIVPYLVQANVWIITALELGTAVARDNVMFLRGEHGSMALQVFWPSAGVHSIIIFSLVIGAFMLKMNIPRTRKTIYFVLGILGTIVVNLIRIFSLSWYALKVTTDPVAWEEYHKIAGEIMFLPWLFAFILIVIVIESKRLNKLESKNLSKNN
ncbi:MAG TPA: thaumarchaeosortase [Nitrosopumilus sp.]|jgi:thaumarchaeosortase|nr:thaumarchaeosortase [Nitrosopumilus sp.]|tara:strand:- start:314 stop:1252 length:939 start_codon:yes stop_codon:yes gene_type:complete